MSALAMLPLVERASRAERRRVALRRFIQTVREPVPLTNQLDSVALAYLDERAKLRRRARAGMSAAERQRMLQHIDGLRAARATIARLIEVEAAHIGDAIAPSIRDRVADAYAGAPTALEVSLA